MPCIHGLDEINCPTCRMIKFNLPESVFKIKDLYYNELRPYNPHFKKHNIEKEDLFKDLNPKKEYLDPNLPHTFPKQYLLNDIPNFNNNKFLERLKEIDITNSDVFGISKKISLKSPELKVEKED